MALSEREKKLVTWFKELWLERFRNPKSVSDVIPRRLDGKYERDFPIVTATEVRGKMAELDPEWAGMAATVKGGGFNPNHNGADLTVLWHTLYAKHIKAWKYEQLRKKERENAAEERGPLD